MSKLTIVEGNSNDKDNVRAIMVKGEKGEMGDLNHNDIIDNLTSTATNKVLSANQGKQLKSLIDSNTNNIENNTNDLEKKNDKLAVHFLSLEENFTTDGIHKLGDCIVATGSKNIIIDFGSQTNCELLINFLNANNITKIDCIVISHFHSDHIGGNNALGFKEFLNQNYDFSNCTVYLPHKNIIWENLIGFSENLVSIKNNETSVIDALTSKNINYAYCDNEEKVVLNENIELQFFNTNIDYTDYYNETTNWNLAELSFAIYNNFSMVTQLKHCDNYFLFAGDIEPLAQSKVYQYLKHCDVLKIEHHGLNYLTDENYLKQLNPKYAVIGTLDNLSDLSMNRATVSYLKDIGTKIFNTLTSGEVIITSKYNKIE